MTAIAVDLSIDNKQKFTDAFLDRNGAPVAGPAGVVPTYISANAAIVTVELVEGSPLDFVVVPADGAAAGQSADVHAVVGGSISDGVVTINLTGGGAVTQQLTAGEVTPKVPSAVVDM